MRSLNDDLTFKISRQKFDQCLCSAPPTFIEVAPFLPAKYSDAIIRYSNHGSKLFRPCPFVGRVLTTAIVLSRSDYFILNEGEDKCSISSQGA